jgi:signal transduction histidine kinase
MADTVLATIPTPCGPCEHALVTEARRDSMTASALAVAVPLVAAIYGLVLVSSVVGPFGRSVQASGLPGAGLRTLDVAIAISLVGAGAATWIGGGRRHVGLIAVIGGLSWLAPYLVLDAGSPAFIRYTAAGLAPLSPILALHLVLAATSHDRIDRRRWRVLVVLYGIAGLLGVLRVATYDPFFDPDCGALCNPVPALFEPPPGSRAVLRQGVHLVSLAAGAALAWWSIGDLASRDRRRRDGWVLAGGALAGASTAALAAISLIRRPAIPGVGEPLLDSLMVMLLWALTGAMLSISLGLALATVAILRVRQGLRRIADDIEATPPPGSLETALAAVLADPTVKVGYWLAEDERYVGPDGRPFGAPDTGPDRQVTSIERSGDPVAIVSHQARLDAATITREIGPSMLVALDNERLRAASLARLRDLQESRTRIVEISDVERRRVERDLHDGAQQGLLALSFDLRLARLNAERRGDTALADLVAAAETLGLDAVEELRRIAHGVHPAVLSQAGLAAALESLGDASPIPMEVRMELAGRAPVATESAVYQVAVEALADAVRREAQELALRVSGDPSQIVIEATDDGALMIEPPVRIADRVGAAGGEVSIRRGPDRLGNVVSAVLPCG